MNQRYVGIDVGAETIKVVELVRDENGLRVARQRIAEHEKAPGASLLDVLRELDWDGVAGAAVSGRLGRLVAVERVPTKQAQATAFRFLRGDEAATIVAIGARGFSVLELRAKGTEVFRENGRCSQGTGNFLRQLVERFDLDIQQASELCAEVDDPAPLSGRCPVILKTDMTHLANKGEARERILAGLYDAVCENVQVLIKPRVCPPKVLLVGGVARARRIRAGFRHFLERHGMELVDVGEDEGLYFEAIGAAVVASERESRPPPLDRLISPPPKVQLEEVPGLSEHLARVTRMHAPPVEDHGRARELCLGFDMGSTGSKAVAVDAETREMLWESYVRTNGNPVGAAQTLMRDFVHSETSRHRVTTVAVTGSGREIVGSLAATCYGVDSVFVLNEIAAHAAGALHFDSRVDTIFEIGGQDAKYIRLSGGRVVDAAMNEACSAGTGSFIEEQGARFAGFENVAQLGCEGLRAERGVSLGQHCSVFMAEIIDQAVAAGVEQPAIVAGIYDSIVQNYLNRVKGSRDVGQVVFCQGMPFSSDALAAAVARQTGCDVITPPNPGTVGALGIALLALEEIPVEARRPLDPRRFLEAGVESKDSFVCQAKRGCGGAGNKCRIDRLAVRLEGRRKRFLWGGSCSLYDRGTRKRKLPDLAPDPFRARDDLVRDMVRDLDESAVGPRIAMTDEFLLKGLFPFFVTFFQRLGLRPLVFTGADQASLKRGIEEANVPFCAPMQLYHGLVGEMLDSEPDFLFLPMLRNTPRVAAEPHSVVCPIVQGSPDMLRLTLCSKTATTLLTPVLDLGKGNLHSAEFHECCERLAREMGIADDSWRGAFRAAVEAQTRFEERCLDLGRAAIEWCKEHDVVPVVVLGRAYTIYNKVLNSNVPAILREQGAVAIPVDCYPVAAEVPIFHDMYWGYGQRNLRAAHQIRRTPGVYGIYCSNYSCGPDSFTLHFYAYVMDGKPFAVIETDGHSGDAGTRTRVEAFLHCVRSDLSVPARAQATELRRLEKDTKRFGEIRRRGERVLIPRMGPAAEALAACLQGLGVPAEALPMPTAETVRLGRRYTSGKECVPMTITLGSLLERLDRARDTDERFAFFMPTANGPCRFGVYNLLHKVNIERLGWKDRVGVWSPADTGYFDTVPGGFAVLAFAGFVTSDLLLEALYDVRPVETSPGAAREIHDRYRAELLSLMRAEAAGDLAIGTALLQVASGRLFGCRDLLRRAATEFAQVKERSDIPTVLLVGEVYARCDPFTNDFVIEKLEERGIRVRFAPFSEWLEYTDYLNLERVGADRFFGTQVSSWVHNLAQNVLYAAVGARLGWPERTTVEESIRAAAPYVRQDLFGEAVLTVGGPVHEWREGHIDAVVSVGPLECMPTKIAEAQFFHAAEREGLLSLTIPLNGDPIDPEVLDNFAFEVHERVRKNGPRARPSAGAALPRVFRGALVQLRRSATTSLRVLGRPARTGARSSDAFA